MSTSIVSVRVAQKEECVGAISSAARNGAVQAIEDLAKTNSLGDSESFQREVIERQGELVAIVRETIRETVKRKIAEMVQKIIGCLRLISGGEEIVVDETDGTETLAQANDVFTGWVDPDFERWGTNIASKPTKKTPAQVLEMAKDGDFQAIFGGLERPLDDLCWAQSQIKSFAKKHVNWLHPKGWATLFLFKVGEGDQKKFFVANVYRFAGKLKVYVFHSSSGGVWSAGNRRRVVVPQLPLKSCES